jgi:hypothetical protein
MHRTLQLSFMLACMSSYAAAAAPPIGTVTARGETQIDGYQVKGSGTVFDGSTIATGQSAQSIADVRLGGSVVTLYVGSRGILYRDHLELQQGRVEVAASNSYRVEVNGLSVTPNETNGSEIVSIDSDKTVNVVAQSGAIEVIGSTGALIAQVHPGNPLAFSPIGSKQPAEFSAMGVVSTDHGHYYLKASEIGVTYELKGANLQDYVGDQVSAAGKFDPSGAHDSAAAGTVDAQSIVNLALAGRQSTQTKAIISGLSIGNSSIDALCGSSGGSGSGGSGSGGSGSGGSAPICYGRDFGGLCCPRGRETESQPPLCCSGDRSFGYCCAGQTYPPEKCHHSH